MSSKTRKPGKKKILYAERDYPEGSSGYSAREFVLATLEEEYRVQPYHGLDHGVVDLLKGASGEEAIDAIVSHAPYRKPKPPASGYGYVLAQRLRPKRGLRVKVDC